MRALTVAERWVRGIPHDPRSEKIAREIAEIDLEQCNDSFCWKFGGDGDNGETLLYLLYLLDVYFEREDAASEDEVIRRALTSLGHSGHPEICPACKEVGR